MKTNRRFICCAALLATIFVTAASTGADREPSRLEQKQIQAWVQDVVSVGIEHDFHNGTISNRDLILFGIYQIALRHPEQFQHGKAAGETQISAQAVASVARRFFGKNLVPQSVEDWTYRAGFYHGYDELFEQLGPQKIQRLRIRKVGRNQLAVDADFIDEMASAESNHQVMVKIKNALATNFFIKRKTLHFDFFSTFVEAPVRVLQVLAARKFIQSTSHRQTKKKR